MIIFTLIIQQGSGLGMVMMACCVPEGTRGPEESSDLHFPDLGQSTSHPIRVPPDIPQNTPQTKASSFFGESPPCGLDHCCSEATCLDFRDLIAIGTDSRVSGNDLALRFSKSASS
jgi:hypothetical protein